MLYVVKADDSTHTGNVRLHTKFTAERMNTKVYESMPRIHSELTNQIVLICAYHRYTRHI